jgi:hypothetical protein
MEKMIAYCGLTCTECPAYIATQTNDAEAMARVAEQWSAEHSAQLTVEDCWCNGCLAEKGPWMSHCAECDIRACGVEKGVENCAQCDDYGCGKLSEFFGFVPAAKETLDGIRSVL